MREGGLISHEPTPSRFPAGGGYIIANFALVMVLFYGGTLVLDGALSVGELTSFILYTLGRISR